MPYALCRRSRTAPSPTRTRSSDRRRSRRCGRSSTWRSRHLRRGAASGTTTVTSRCRRRTTSCGCRSTRTLRGCCCRCLLVDDVADRQAALVEVNRLNRTEFGLTFFLTDQRISVTRELGLEVAEPAAVRIEIDPDAVAGRRLGTRPRRARPHGARACGRAAGQPVRDGVRRDGRARARRPRVGGAGRDGADLRQRHRPPAQGDPDHREAPPGDAHADARARGQRVGGPRRRWRGHDTTTSATSRRGCGPGCD